MKDDAGFILSTILVIVLYSLFMVLIGAESQKDEMKRKAVAAGVAYWTPDKYGNPEFKYITE
jgi:hypothetical protein